VAVYYGYDRVPALDEHAHGGMVKFQQLDRFFPNEPRSFSILYLGSSTVARDSSLLIKLARERGARFIWNQNGVAYRGWHGPGWEPMNEPLAEALHAADHVFFQSEFCKRSSDRFLGEPIGSWEVLHNPVDTTRFAPAPGRAHGLTVLLGGNQYQRYRLETGLRAFARVTAERPDARLLVTGALSWSQATEPQEARRSARRWVAELGLEDRVHFVGRYTQADAPALYRRATVLLHTKYNDPCPTVVLEAMACGLPVVYSASGGTPELVGPYAGVGIPAPLDWERDHPPAPDALAAAILEVSEQQPECSEAARQRAIDRFDLHRWVARHREVFEELTAR
jgi:glycosyltransferase involved in cell wall biosynthesis